jgi:hypothetical protein
MTKDERWMIRCNEGKNFIEVNHRNPSKYYPEEKLIFLLWIKGDCYNEY